MVIKLVETNLKNIVGEERSPPNILFTLEEILHDYSNKYDAFKEIIPLYIYWDAWKLKMVYLEVWMDLLISHFNKVNKWIETSNT